VKIIAIVNGKARNKKLVLDDLERITNHDLDVLVTKKAQDTIDFTHDAIGKSPDLLIICGGDGTANRVVNSLMDYEVAKRPTLAIFPSGSANDFSRSLKHESIEKTIFRFEQGNKIPVDLSLIQTLQGSVYSLNMATMGLGANVARTVNKRKGRTPAAFKFFSSTIGWVLAYKPAKIQIQIGDVTIKMRPYMAAFGNGKFVGYGLGICPQAVLGDGNFAVTLISKIGIFDYARYISTIRQAKEIKNDLRVIYHTAKFAEIKVLERKLGIETDGEFFQTLQKGETVRITSVPSALFFVSGVA
jgi:diacylglycerol kinase (ATP)